MRKVLIISYYFPPINMLASKRYGTMCKYLEENGYKPYVLTTRHYEDRENGIRLEQEIPIDKEQIIQIGNVRSNAEIRNPVWEMVLTLLMNHRYCPRTIETGGIGWYERVKAEGNLEKLRDMDVIIGTFPPMSNLFIAWYLSRKLKIPFIAEIRDLISDYSETPAGYKRTFWLDRLIERYILQKAAAFVTVTPGYKKVLRARYPRKRIEVVYNGWDGDRAEKKDVQEIQTEKYLYYAGTLYPHRLESFELLVRCLKKMNADRSEKIKFILRSAGPVDLTAKARYIVRQEEMMEYVQVLTAVSEDIVREEQDKAYINIVLSSLHSEDRALMTTVPGKVYELLKERAPVLAVVPDHSDVAKVINYTKKGIASVNEKEIIDFILNENEYYTGGQKIEFFSRRRQSKKLCRFIDCLLVEPYGDGRASERIVKRLSGRYHK